MRDGECRIALVPLPIAGAPPGDPALPPASAGVVSALRRALLDPDDHRPWLDVAAAREKQGALTGSLQALSRAHGLDGVEEARRSSTFERVRLRLN